MTDFEAIYGSSSRSETLRVGSSWLDIRGAMATQKSLIQQSAFT